MHSFPDSPSRQLHGQKLECFFSVRLLGWMEVLTLEAMPLETWKSCLWTLCLQRTGAGHHQLRTPKRPTAAGAKPPPHTPGTIQQGHWVHSQVVPCFNPSPQAYPWHRPCPASQHRLAAPPSQPQSMVVKHSDLCVCSGSSSLQLKGAQCLNWLRDEMQRAQQLHRQWRSQGR
jgi:hypothetical protein